MKMKRGLEVSIVILLFFVCLLGVKIFSLVFGINNFQDTILRANATSYDIYVEENKLATVYDYDAMSKFLTDKYQDKMGRGTGDLFFGKNVSVVEKYTDASEKKDDIKTYEKIADEASFTVEAMRIKDSDLTKEYYVANLKVWDNAVAQIATVITATDAEVSNQNKIVLGTTIEPEIVSVDVRDVLDEKQLISEIMNEGNLVYQTQETTTLDQISTEVGISKDELLTLNPQYDENSVIFSDAPVEITDGAYRNHFTQMKVLQEEEAIPYAIEYVDDDEQYTGVEQVIQEGIDGRQMVQLSVKDLVSGERVILNKETQNVIEQPQSQIILRGTKEAPFVGTGNFIWPVTSRRVSTEFGIDYLGGEQRYHVALDINEGFGAPIMAIDNGTVVEVGFDSGYGYFIIIDHNNGFWSLYAHNQSNNVRVGQIVPQGEVIAYMGSTGLSTGPHLHLEIRKGGNSKTFAVDPRIYIS